ncbi:hypothetical protein BKA67DRAFT_180984 [Truncatella angustata]|uniref:Uncharacterized protein n=1 Tax=Truncatella angustata TaxID=152316 RepID=A0A9P8US21_9PEZI|nr:uncharacterized protein BKA67DRAFT_180984 [Truncatella angustata]KAH6657151.1 hypothetical protein BKA67DRAFT_180984 [Truncatella angustata]
MPASVESSKATRVANKSAAPRVPPLPYKARTAADAAAGQNSALMPSVEAHAASAAPVRAAAKGSTVSLPQSLRAPTPKPFDPSSPAYKAASRKYVGFMVAMPILLVTSYVLFDRLALGHEAKSFDKQETARSIV